MDLKIKDVAELLKVSETTIRRWLSNGQIPAYRINHQYRFNRLEIENWMISCKIKQEEKNSTSPQEEEFELPIAKSGTQQFSVFRALHKGDVLVDLCGTKEAIIRQGAQVAAAKLGLDEDLVAELLLDRERLMPTALSHGVAVPHPRELIVKEPASDLIIVVFPKEPIDFGALDGQPIHTLFFLFSSQDKKHLQLLAKIAHLSAHPDSLAFLRSKPNKEELMTFIRAWEGTIAY